MNTRNAVRRPLVLLGALVVVAAPLAACGSDDKADSSSTTSADAGSTVSVTDVWARPGTSGGNSAIYMKVVGGKDADSLTAAEVPGDVAGQTQIHETVMSADSGSSTTAMSGSSTTAMSGSSTTAMSGSSTTAAGSGMMSMQPVDKVEIPAGGTVEFKPGGYHVMLLDLKKDLKAGDTVKVKLTFTKAGEQEATATVKDV
jgi:periplasmic copper chaperone A